MRNLILFLLPAITFAQSITLDIDNLNRDYTDALFITNSIRSYWQYPELKHSDSLSLIAKEAAQQYLKTDETYGNTTVFYYVDRHQFSLKDNYIRDAVVAWSVDTDLETREETFSSIMNYDATLIGFAIEEKDGFICVTAKFDK
jgi:hypothetical protein